MPEPQGATEIPLRFGRADSLIRGLQILLRDRLLWIRHPEAYELSPQTPPRKD